MKNATAVVAALLGLTVLGASTRPMPTPSPPTAHRGSHVPLIRDSNAVLVLKIERFGGWGAPREGIAELPRVSAFADGRIVFPAPLADVYPSPALRPARVKLLGAQPVARLAEAAVAAGVGTGTDFGDPRIAGAQTTRITVAAAAGTHQVTILGLHEATPGDADLTPGQQRARAAVAAFVNQTVRVTTDAYPVSRPYVPHALAALARPRVLPAKGMFGHPAARIWPGPLLAARALPGAGGFGCTVAAGRTADRVRVAAAHATAVTPWVCGGAVWTVTLRPLLPHERSCADLASQW